MKTIIAVSAIALLPLSAVAQSFDGAGMMASFTMLESNVANILEDYNIEFDVQALTVAQLAEIVAVANSSDSEADNRERIETALAIQ